MSGKKRYEGVMLLALREGGWGSNFQENSITLTYVTLEWPLIVDKTNYTIHIVYNLL